MIQFQEKAERTEGQTEGTEFIRPHYHGSNNIFGASIILFADVSIIQNGLGVL